MVDSLFLAVAFGYIAVGIVLADFNLRFFSWQRFSRFYREIAKKAREDSPILFLYYLGWCLLWPALLTALIPFFFLLIRALFIEWWYGSTIPFIIETPAVLSFRRAKDLSLGDWRCDTAVWDALNIRGADEVLLIKCKSCNGRSYYDGGEHAHCFHCDKDLTPDLESHMPPWPRLVPNILTVAQIIEKENKEKSF